MRSVLRNKPTQALGRAQNGISIMCARSLAYVRSLLFLWRAYAIAAVW